ncbi:Ribokinase-like protein [Ramicandelaber brevisporus]|nr:Ribokinase-like protein [Ramicandelaber brevisporus]
MTASSVDEQLKGPIVGLCNPLLDINAAVELPFLDKYDLKANDGILADDKHLPLYEELERDYPITYTVGGAGQNTLRGAQRFLPSGSTVFMGSVGADEHAVKLQAKAAEDGLRTEYYVDTEKPTGVSACLITDNNRSLVTNLSAANSFKIDHIQKPEIKALIENAKYFYITGFFITVSPDTILSIAKHAHETGKPFMMNISAPFRRLDVFNRGANGHTTRQARILVPQYIPAAGSAEAVKVKLVTIFYGTNDASIETSPNHVPVDEYKVHLHAVIATIHERVPLAKILVITPGPIAEELLEKKTRQNDRAKMYSEAAKGTVAGIIDNNVVGIESIAVFDFWTAVKEDSESGLHPLSDYVVDGLHLSKRGNAVLFEGVKEIIESKWPQLSVDALQQVPPAFLCLSADPAERKLQLTLV